MRVFGDIIGDPIVTNLDGSVYKFNGVPGAAYVALSGFGFTVTQRFAGTPLDASVSFVDRLEVSTSGHRLVMDLDVCTLDGRALPVAEMWHRVEGMRVKHWVGLGGERRADVVVGDWAFGLLCDDGKNKALHADGPLSGVPHLGLFVDRLPFLGLLVMGNGSSDPKDFEAAR